VTCFFERLSIHEWEEKSREKPSSRALVKHPNTLGLFHSPSRSDFFPLCFDYAPLVKPRRQLLVQRLRAERLCGAIENSARAAKLLLQRGLEEKMTQFLSTLLGQWTGLVLALAILEIFMLARS